MTATRDDGSTDEVRPGPPMTVPREHGTQPSDAEVVYRVDPDVEIAGARRPGLDVPATIAGALAALGALLLLSSIVGAAIGTIGYQYDVDGHAVSVGSLVGGLVVLALACLAGGWVAGRMARHHGGRHGLVAVAWLVVLAAVVAALAAIFGDDLDVRDALGLPRWFSSDADRTAAIVTGVLAGLIMLLAGLLGGRIGARGHRRETVDLVSTHHRARVRSGGIGAGTVDSREVR